MNDKQVNAGVEWKSKKKREYKAPVLAAYGNLSNLTQFDCQAEGSDNFGGSDAID